MFALSFGSGIAVIVITVIILGVFAFLIFAATLYRKVEQGKALVKNGMGGTKVTFSGMVIWPVIHRAEIMAGTRVFYPLGGEVPWRSADGGFFRSWV